MTTHDDLHQAAADLVADWPPLTAAQLDLVRRTYGRVQLDPPALADAA